MLEVGSPITYLLIWSTISSKWYDFIQKGCRQILVVSQSGSFLRKYSLFQKVFGAK